MFPIIATAFLIALPTIAANAKEREIAETCHSSVESGWSEIERNAWLSICSTGRVKLADTVTISGTFLAEVLRKASIGDIGQAGVRVYGGVVRGEVRANDLEIKVPVTLDRMRFTSRVTLSNSVFGKSLSVDGSVFEDPLDLNGIRIGRFFMARAATFDQLDLRSARVDGPLYLSGSRVNGQLNLMRATIRQSLTLDTPAKHASSRDPDLAWNTRQAEFVGKVILQAAEVGHLLDMRGSFFRDQVDMRRVKIGKSLLMRSGASFSGKVIGHGAVVHGSLDIRGSDFQGDLDLSFAVVDEDFRIGQNDDGKCTSWGNSANVMLTNARLESIQDTLCRRENDESDDEGVEQSLQHWPAKVEFTGLSYTLLSGYDQSASQTIASRGADWFKRWLSRQREYSPQPYRKLADVLEAHGYGDTAIAVRTAGKNRELWETRKLSRKLNLLLQWLFIGYGYGTGRVALWVLLLTLLGSEVIRQTPQGADKSLLYRVFYSFDHLIPIVKLSEEHYKKELANWPRYYFFLHTLMGFVLGSYLVAGLTGVAT